MKSKLQAKLEKLIAYYGKKLARADKALSRIEKDMEAARIIETVRKLPDRKMQEITLNNCFEERRRQWAVREIYFNILIDLATLLVHCDKQNETH